MNNILATSKKYHVQAMQFDGTEQGAKDLQTWLQPIESNINLNGGQPEVEIFSGSHTETAQQGDYVILYPTGGFAIFDSEKFREFFSK